MSRHHVVPHPNAAHSFTTTSAASRHSLPTKIEFSRRGLEDDVGFESVDPRLIRAYQLPPFMVSHYRSNAAVGQKVGALAHRRELQARNVFDLRHLIAAGAGAEAFLRLDPRDVEQACANALAIDFATFKSQVLAFLPTEDQTHYDSPAVWDTLVSPPCRRRSSTPETRLHVWVSTPPMRARCSLGWRPRGR